MYPWSRKRSRSAARPASSGEAPQTPRSAVQPARTVAQSHDALLRMQGSIFTADAKNYAHWINDNPQASGKTLSNLVGLIQVSMRHAFQSCASQSAPQGIPFSVLLGWLLTKCHNRYTATITDALHDLAVAEHRFFHVFKLVEKGEQVNKDTLSPDTKIDLQMIHECLQLCNEESERKKAMIKDICKSSAEQSGRELYSIASAAQPAVLDGLGESSTACMTAASTIDDSCTLSRRYIRGLQVNSFR